MKMPGKNSPGRKGGSRILRSVLLERLILLLPSILYLLALPAIWILEFSIFLPFIVAANILTRRRPAAVGSPPAITNYIPGEVLFDRLQDISKIAGCDTRNVGYSWSLFLDAIVSVTSSGSSERPSFALDFGAGCLRDTYELARLGFRVTSCDLNREAMMEGVRFYDWSKVTAPPALVASLSEAESARRYEVITAFDVIEHLYVPEKILAHLRGLLAPTGVLLVTVPNRRAVSEMVFRLMFIIRSRQDRLDRVTGAPHVQFRTPEEWKSFFRENGFSIERHEMTVGFLVNDLWVNFYAWPCRLLVEPWIVLICGRLNIKYRANAFEELFYPRWLMAQVDRLDILFEPIFKGRWGWNLFVLKNV